MDNISLNINIPYSAIEAFCQKWKITELALFGSVLRSDFTSESDIDILVTLRPEVRLRYSLFDSVKMTDELRSIFGRKVDLVKRNTLRNPFRRQEILATAQTIYEYK